MKRHAVHLTSAHSADDVRIFRKESLSLVRHGFEVTIVARESPGPVDGGGVRRVFVPARRGRLSRLVRTTLDVLVAALRLRGDIYHIHDPELLPVALILRLCGHRVVYDVHEDVAKQNLHKDWIPRPLRGSFAATINLVERLISARLSGIVAATDPIGRKFPHPHVAIVRNYPPAPAAPDPEPAIEAGRVVYAGGMSEARGLLHLVEAVNLVRRKCTLACAGNVDATLARRIGERDLLGRTELLGWLRAEQVRGLYRSGSIGVVTLLPTPAHVESLPLKLFEYMAAGLPVIASDFPAWRPFVLERECGICVDPADPAAIAAAIEGLLGDPVRARAMGRRGREAILEEFNWASQERHLVDLYRKVLGEEGAGSAPSARNRLDRRRGPGYSPAPPDRPARSPAA